MVAMVLAQAASVHNKPCAMVKTSTVNLSRNELITNAVGKKVKCVGTCLTAKIKYMDDV